MPKKFSMKLPLLLLGVPKMLKPCEVGCTGG